MAEIHKLVALADDLEWFFLAALKGKTPSEHTREPYDSIGSQRTPISFGLSEGYPCTDIAHFYISRQLGNNWVEEIIKNLNPKSMGMDYFDLYIFFFAVFSNNVNYKFPGALFFVY